MPGSSVLRQALSRLFFPEEHHPPPYSFTVTAVAGNYHSLQLTSPSYHTILLFIVPALLDLLELLYPDGTSPFTTHPKTMRFAAGCLLAYCIFYAAELSFSSRHFRHGMMLFGSMCVVSLYSIFFEDSLQWVVYMLYTLLWTGILLSSLSPLMLYKLPGQVEALVRPMWDKCRGLSVSVFRGHTFRFRGNILPL